MFIVICRLLPLYHVEIMCFSTDACWLCCDYQPLTLVTLVIMRWVEIEDRGSVAFGWLDHKINFL